MPSPYEVTNPLGIQYSTIVPVFPEWAIPAGGGQQAAIDAFNVRVDAVYAFSTAYVSVTAFGSNAMQAMTLWILHLMKVDPRGQILSDHVMMIEQTFAAFKDQKLTVYAVLFEELRATQRHTFRFIGL